ncbi:glycosyltransferase family 2 protein [Fusibacillus kribbianus]|uniref:Glycosyltransferase family A protein n=1 Tax=Fusibacillus kribbianus TaxID=3044208 RepID=A0AAP4EZ89_9FIRM|nr:glycosyltransferase [Ruminococcus sp. YH-rum2234]MDI9241630.1 glycosyltransferase family A protein [Ruminococcus sp. YH-rum2234]
MSTLISVIMTTYNKDEYIAESIQSVLNQTYENLQLIIVDDGSTDQTADVVRSFSDPRIEFYQLPVNGHIAYATNFAFTKIRGEYTAIIDSDDIWVETKLEKQMEYLQLHPEHHGCFSWLDIIDDDGNLINDQLSDLKNLFAAHTDTREDWLRFFFFMGNRLNNPSAVFKTSTISQIGPHNLFYNQATDMEWWVRFTRHYSFGILEEPLTKYRRFLKSDRNNSGISEEHNTRFYNEHMHIRYHFFDDMDDELFCRTFRQYFRNPYAQTPAELECEKAFLICLSSKYSPDGIYNPLGLLKIEELLCRPETSQLLKEHYHFSTKECSQYTGHHLYNDSELQHSYKSLCDAFQKSTEENIALQSHIDALKQHIQYTERKNKASLFRFKMCEEKYQTEICYVQEQLYETQKQLHDTQERLSASFVVLNTITNSTCWKITAPIRRLIDFFKSIVAHK